MTADHGRSFLFFCGLIDIFGGPIAHRLLPRRICHTAALALERSYADLVALVSSCRGLQKQPVGIAVGLSRADTAGRWLLGLASRAAVCHSLDPFALGISSYGDYVSQGALHGFKSGGCGRGRSSSMGHGA